MGGRAEYEASRRAERAAAGLCPLCGKTAPEEGFKRCESCREKAKRHKKAWNERNPDNVLARRRRAYRHIREDPERNARYVAAQRERSKGREEARPTRNRRPYELMNNYGLTIEQYTLMLAGQGGGCAICGTAPDEGKHLDVDHCHAGGHVRGLLCRSCNLGLGRFRDNAGTLRAAIDYLMSFP